MSSKGTVRKAYLQENAATICQECGRSFRMLGRHLPVAHGMSARDYKLKYGLPLTCGLVCSETFDALSRSKQQLWKERPDLQTTMILANPPGTRDYGRTGRKSEGLLADILRVRNTAYHQMCRDKAAALWNGRKERFIELWKSGISLREMGKEFNCRPSTIRNHMIKWGLPRRRMTFVLDKPVNG
jgi:hypothetical protein